MRLCAFFPAFFVFTLFVCMPVSLGVCVSDRSRGMLTEGGGNDCVQLCVRVTAMSNFLASLMGSSFFRKNGNQFKNTSTLRPIHTPHIACVTYSHSLRRLTLFQNIHK